MSSGTSGGGSGASISASSTVTDVAKMELPTPNSLTHASKLAVMEDKPIMFDYWVDSLDSQVFIGIKSDGEGNGTEKILVKNAEEYTSPIAKLYKVDDTFVICTVNSIYIVKANIPRKKLA